MNTYKTNPNLDPWGYPVVNDSPLPGILWNRQSGIVTRYDDADLIESDDAALLALFNHFWTELSETHNHNELTIGYTDTEHPEPFLRIVRN